MATIPVRTAETIYDEIEKVYDDITKKAYERFLERRGTYSLDIEDWLEAEKQLLWKPDVRLTEKRDVFVIRVGLIGIDPSTIDVLATAEDVLIQSREGTCKPRIFKAVHFPSPVVPLQIHGTYVKQTLLLIAPKVSSPRRTSAATPARGVLNFCL
jgi:HSP20 family molecular chaperone IbpA